MSTALQDLQEKIKAELAAIRDSVAPPSSNRISTRGKKFTLPTGESNPGPMTAIILDHRNYNRYYTKPYDAQNPSPPDCFALSKSFDGLSPQNHAEVTDPQADACAGCPMNRWGTGRNGKGKACRNMVRLALVAPDCANDVAPWTLEIPPTSLKHWNKLVNDLETVGKLPIQAVTEIGFDPTSPYECPTFHIVDLHDDLERFWALRERAQTALNQPPGKETAHSFAPA